MRYWRYGNDLYTADTQPVEGAVEITADEYTAIYNSREITHLPEMEQEEFYGQDL